MRDIVILLLSGMAGTALGGVFFGGLWWTVRIGLTVRHPALWFLASLLVRMSALLAGLYLVGGRHWDRLVACLIGFVLGRLIVTGLTRLPAGRRPHPAIEVSHAP
jgi:F1F0 ATPase subunit 2